MSYALQVLLNEGLKIIILAVFFLIIGKFKIFAFSLLLLSSLRIFAGGYHSNSFLGCFTFSFIFFALAISGSIYLANFIIKYQLVMIVFALVVIAKQSPIPSKYRPIKQKKRYYTLKILAIFTALIWYVILLLFKYNIELFSAGILTIFLESVQLLFIKGDSICN